MNGIPKMEYQVLFEFLRVKYVSSQKLEFHFCILCRGEPRKKLNKGLVGVWVAAVVYQLLPPDFDSQGFLTV